MTRLDRHPAPATTVAGAIVSTLRSYGVDRVFSVAGESYLPLLDALVDQPDLDVVTCRHEGSAGFAAIADAKLTGRPGVCLVSRGPGATNAAVAVHAAWQDATPLLVIVGHVPRSEIGRGAFQEFDPSAMFGSLTKGAWVVQSGARTAEFLHRALHHARAGTPGPVVVAIPDDVYGDDAGDWPELDASQGSAGAPAADVVYQVVAMLDTACRPLLLAGGLLSTPDGRAALAGAAERHGLPVACSNKHQDVFDNTDRHYAGHLSNSTPREQRALLGEADLILAIGTRLDTVTTGRFQLPRAPRGPQPLVHVYPDETRIGERYRPDVGVCADPAAFLRALTAQPPLHADRYAGWVAELHDQEAARSRWTPVAADDGVVFGEVVAVLDRLTGGDLVLTVDAGGFTSWLYRYLHLTGDARLLGVSSSTMGFGVPAAVAAALRRPERPVVCVVGDGGFQMNGSELSVAVARRIRLVILIANNGSYGTIRNHQERVFPGRVIATDLVNPRFAALAEAYGALGLSIDSSEEVEPMLAKALSHDGPVVVDIRTSLTQFSASYPLGAGKS